jgi:hypothetical protein
LGRPQVSVVKRQREQAKRERKQVKAEKKALRKNEKGTVDGEVDDSIDWEAAILPGSGEAEEAEESV